MSVKSNLFSTLQNASQKSKLYVYVDASKYAYRFLKLLATQGIIKGFSREGLQYKVDLKKILISIKMHSRPGKQVYTKSKHIPVCKNGLGFYVLSTKDGLYTDNQARSLNLGGELVCMISIS